MTGVKEAVQKATSLILDLYPRARAIRLEEAERMDPNWSIVLSFGIEDPNPFEALSPFGMVVREDSRLFKTVMIDTETGEPLALKVWKS